MNKKSHWIFGPAVLGCAPRRFYSITSQTSLEKTRLGIEASGTFCSHQSAASGDFFLNASMASRVSTWWPPAFSALPPRTPIWIPLEGCLGIGISTPIHSSLTHSGACPGGVAMILIELIKNSFLLIVY